MSWIKRLALPEGCCLRVLKSKLTVLAAFSSEGSSLASKMAGFTWVSLCDSVIPPRVQVLFY